MNMTDTSFSNTYLLKYPCMGRLQRLRVFTTPGTIVQQVDIQYDDFISLDEPDIHVSFSAGKGYRLTPEECSLLMGVRNPDDRWAIFNDKAWLEEGLRSIKKNSEVKLLGSDARAIVRYRGYIPEKGIGIYYGIEFQFPNEICDTDGSVGDRRLFSCPSSTGAFVGIAQIRLLKERPPVPKKPRRTTIHSESYEDTRVTPTFSAEYEHLQYTKTSESCASSKNEEVPNNTSKPAIASTPTKLKADSEKKQAGISMVTAWKDTPRPVKHSDNAHPQLKSFPSHEGKTWFKTVTSYAERLSGEDKTPVKGASSDEVKPSAKPVTSYEKKTWVNPATLQEDKSWIKPVKSHEENSWANTGMSHENKGFAKPVIFQKHKIAAKPATTCEDKTPVIPARPMNIKTANNDMWEAGRSDLINRNGPISRQSSRTEDAKEVCPTGEEYMKELFEGMRKLEQRFDNLELLIKNQLEEQNSKIKKLQKQFENHTKQTNESSSSRSLLQSEVLDNKNDAKLAHLTEFPTNLLSESTSDQYPSALLQSIFKEIERSVQSTVYPILRTDVAVSGLADQGSRKPAGNERHHTATKTNTYSSNDEAEHIHRKETITKYEDTDSNVETINASMLQSEALLSTCSELQKIIETNITGIDKRLEEVVSLTQDSGKERHENDNSHNKTEVVSSSRQEANTIDQKMLPVALTELTETEVCPGLMVCPKEMTLKDSETQARHTGESTLNGNEAASIRESTTSPVITTRSEESEVCPERFVSPNELKEQGINGTKSTQSTFHDKETKNREEEVLFPVIMAEPKEAEICPGLMASPHKLTVGYNIAKTNDHNSSSEDLIVNNKETVEEGQKIVLPVIMTEPKQADISPGLMVSTTKLSADNSSSRTDDFQSNIAGSLIENKEPSREKEKPLLPVIIAEPKEAEVCPGLMVFPNKLILEDCHNVSNSTQSEIGNIEMEKAEENLLSPITVEVMQEETCHGLIGSSEELVFEDSLSNIDGNELNAIEDSLEKSKAAVLLHEPIEVCSGLLVSPHKLALDDTVNTTNSNESHLKDEGSNKQGEVQVEELITF